MRWVARRWRTVPGMLVERVLTSPEATAASPRFIALELRVRKHGRSSPDGVAAGSIKVRTMGTFYSVTGVTLFDGKVTPQADGRGLYDGMWALYQAAEKGRQICA